MRRVLDDIDRFCVQSEESARRFIELGADPGRVVVTGSLKFDSLDLPSTAPQARARDRVLRYFRVPPSRPVIVAGSTMKGEEAAVLRAFRRVRVDDAERAADPRAAQPRTLRRSRSSSPAPKAGKWRGAPTSPSTPSRASTSSCSTPSASWPRCTSGDRGVRRRQPRGDRRSQRARAGGVRQADRLRAAHGELLRDCRCVRQQRRRRAGRAASTSSKKRSSR